MGVEERADLARNVDVALEAVEEILGALLDISRLDAGATRPEISDVPVADLMGMLEIEFAALARAKGLDLVFVPTTLAVRTDRRLMRRLMQNLISNALKYTLSGRVLVGCRRVRGAARIEVWDTGIGIPPEHERAVFAEFRRLDQGARVARGLGLGLSIVERLGRVLEHPVGLRSRAGKGSVFSVTAPLGRAAPKPRAAPGAPEPIAAGEPLDGLKVLAIDNEPRVLEGMRVLLERWGCVVATAHGLAEASAALAEFGEPDVIIADYHLDLGDGVIADPGVARAVRPQDSRHPRHRRSKPRGPGRGGARGRPGHEQAAQARAFKGAAHALRRNAGGGGVGEAKPQQNPSRGQQNQSPSKRNPSRTQQNQNPAQQNPNRNFRLFNGLASFGHGRILNQPFMGSDAAD